MFKKHLVVLFFLVVTVPTIIDAGFAIKSEEYQKTKNVGFNFTNVDLGNRMNQIQCSRMCSEDSNCLGVEFQETATGEVRCFKMNNDSSADAVLQDDLGLVYMKGIFLNNLEDMFCAVNFNFRKKNSTTDTFSDSRGRSNGEPC